MSGETDLELLERLAANPLFLGLGGDISEPLRSLWNRRLVQGKLSRTPLMFEVTLTGHGKAELHRLREEKHRMESAISGNTHMLLNRLGFSYPGRVLKEYHAALVHAHEEHPHFADDMGEALMVLTEEVGEVARALLEGEPHQALKELAQVQAVVTRFMDFVLVKTEGGR